MLTPSTPNFISAVRKVSWPRFDGLSLTLKFDACRFKSSDFILLNVPCPPSISSAAKRRQAEYLAGRYAAGLLLEESGYPDFVLVTGENRSPCWPPAVSGSLSHSRDTVLCALQNRGEGNKGIGIDVEALIKSDRARLIYDEIINSAESSRTGRLPLMLRTTLIFSAKESLYKAISHLTPLLPGFHDAELTDLDRANGSFRLELCRDLGSELRQGTCFNGCYRFYEDKVMTLIHF